MNWKAFLKIKLTFLFIPFKMIAVLTNGLSDPVKLVQVRIDLLVLNRFYLAFGTNFKLNELVPAISIFGLNVVNNSLVLSLVFSCYL